MYMHHSGQQEVVSQPLWWSWIHKQWWLDEGYFHGDSYGLCHWSWKKESVYMKRVICQDTSPYCWPFYTMVKYPSPLETLSQLYCLIYHTILSSQSLLRQSINLNGRMNTEKAVHHPPQPLRPALWCGGCTKKPAELSSGLEWGRLCTAALAAVLPCRLQWLPGETWGKLHDNL